MVDDLINAEDSAPSSIAESISSDCQQHSQLEQQLSRPACPSAQAWEQYSFPSFSTADGGATVQVQGSQAQACLFIAMGFLVTESFINRDGPNWDHLFRGSLRSARLFCTQAPAGTTADEIMKRQRSVPRKNSNHQANSLTSSKRFLPLNALLNMKTNLGAQKH